MYILLIKEGANIYSIYVHCALYRTETVINISNKYVLPTAYICYTIS